MNDTKLAFGFGNAKLSTAISTFSLPAGHSCPFAKDCMSRTNLLTGKVTDGPHCKFRCFAATSEARATNVRKQRWGNFTTLKKTNSIESMANLIQKSLPVGLAFVRIHVSGDFFSEKYFLAWLNVALNNPSVTFYGYTKATPFMVKYRKVIPSNLRLTASRGGTHDNLIGKYHLKSAEVVFSLDEAKQKGLEIDHDDSLAINGKKPFALLLHGAQPAKSAASRAWEIIKHTIGGYSKKNNARRIRTENSVPIKIKLKAGKLLVPVVHVQKDLASVPAHLMVENGEFTLA